jgi:hypothetical protein
MTRQCAAEHDLGASRDRRMRIDRLGHSIHSGRWMDQPRILSLSSMRRTVLCAAMSMSQPPDTSPRRISGAARSDEKPSVTASIRRPMLDPTPYLLLHEVTALLRARRLANARRPPPRGTAESS